MLYTNLDSENCINARLTAYINSHKTITAEQQEALTFEQLLAVIQIIEAQQKQTA